jgi:hypothetical protein
MEELFSPTEPGISHPIRNTAIRLMDDGRICILAGNGAGIVLDTDTGEVTIYGKEINFVAGEIKIDGNHINKDMITSKVIKDFKSNETGGAITKKLAELQEKEKK